MKEFECCGSYDSEGGCCPIKGKWAFINTFDDLPALMKYWETYHSPLTFEYEKTEEGFELYVKFKE